MEPPRIFESAAIKAAVSLAEKVGPTNIPVLLAGETGSGKEIIAELIHANSARREREMICVNCAGLPAELIESELFGSRKGAFTGSVEDRVGLVRHADGSTLFLDELSDMPLHLQSKLLRFIQDKRIRRLGGVKQESVDVRIVAAVNRPPLACVADKCLREDLYYRLSAITISVPPLRERKEDILPLATAYLDFFSKQFEREPPAFSKTAIDLMLGHGWPGNVRQLINLMTRCALLCKREITDVDLGLRQSPTTDTLQCWLNRDVNNMNTKERVDAKILIDALLATNFNRLEAAALLGISRGTVYEKIKRLGIKMPAKRVRVAKPTPPRNGHAVPSIVLPSLPVRAPRAPRAASPPAESPAESSVGLPGEGFLD